MKTLILHLMNWMARPYGFMNIIVLLVFGCFVFLVGCAVAFKPYITDGLEVLHAHKLRVLIRVIVFLVFSCWCVLGCICRALIYYFPEDFEDGRSH